MSGKSKLGTGVRSQVSGVRNSSKLNVAVESGPQTLRLNPSTAHQLRPRWEQQILLPLATPESEFLLPTLLLDGWMRAHGLRASGRPGRRWKVPGPPHRSG